jgi:hypothetical protein
MRICRTTTSEYTQPLAPGFINRSSTIVLSDALEASVYRGRRTEDADRAASVRAVVAVAVRFLDSGER